RAALEEDWLARAPRAPQERIVLHVAGADLDDVGVFGDDVDHLRLERLRDDGEAGLLARSGEESEPLEPEALKRVRRRSRLEGPATQDRGPGRAQAMRGGQDLL